MGRTLAQKIFSRSEKYFELYPNIELKLPLMMRKASLEITKALVFQTLLYSTEILVLGVERVKEKNPVFPGSSQVLYWNRQTLFAFLQLPLQWLLRFLPHVRV